MASDILFLGLGYSALPLAERLVREGHRVTGTTRAAAKAMQIAGRGIAPLGWQAPAPLPRGPVEAADFLVVSTAPSEGGCPSLAGLEALGPHPFIRAPRILYLSSSGVYGDHEGAWIDEEAVCRPGTERGKARLAAERAWQGFAEANHAELTLCRLAGIYGPGRSAIDSLSGETKGARAGLTRRIHKPGHVFNRIHRDDIAEGLHALIRTAAPVPILNFADDEPSAPSDPITFAAELLGIEPPPFQDFEEIEAELSPMARSFYAESKRLENDRLKELIGRLAYPTYREGLRAVFEARSR
jgi:nucleoside-diphosphate-sugar epimerase